MPSDNDFRYYKLIGGHHTGLDINGKEVRYKFGDMVPSKANLAERWPEKFQALDSTGETDARPNETREQYLDRMNKLIAVQVAKFDAKELVQKAVDDKNAPNVEPPSDKAICEQMTLKELSAYAEENEIELEEGLSKEGAFAAISASKGW